MTIVPYTLLSCVLNIIVITSESGMLYPFVMLEWEKENDQPLEKYWHSRADLIPSLCLEWVELEFMMKVASRKGDSLSPWHYSQLALIRGCWTLSLLTYQSL